MSDHPNAALIRAYTDHFASGRIEAMFAMQRGDEIVWDVASGGGEAVVPYLGRFEGEAACRARLGIYDRAVELEKFIVHEVLGDGGKAVAIIEETIRVKATGRRARTPLIEITTMPEGSITEVRAFFDTAALVDAFRV